MITSHYTHRPPFSTQDMSGNAARAAAPSKREAHKIANELARAQEQRAERLGGLPQNYPQVLFPNDERDTKYGILRELAPQITHEVTATDLQYIEEKRKEQLHLEWLIFLNTQFDLTDPAEAEMARQKFPDMYDAAKKYMRAMMANVAKFQELDQMGLHTDDDYLFLYKVLTGTIHIPSGFRADQLGVPMAFAGQPAIFDPANRGLLNPMRYLAGTYRRPHINPGRNADNSQNPWEQTRLAANPSRRQQMQANAATAPRNFAREGTAQAIGGLFDYGGGNPPANYLGVR